MKRIEVKLNFFQKLMIYSISITIIGIIVFFLLNMTFLDKFYIYRKKIEIPLIAKEIKSLKNNPEKLQAYIESESYENGVIINFRTMSHMTRNRENIGENNQRFSAYEKGMRQRDVELKYTKVGRRYLTYKDVVDGIPLTITLPLVSIESYKYESWLIGVISIMITLMAIVILGRYFSRKLTKNIEVLNRAAKKMANLEFVEKLNISSKDEIGELADSVEEMSHNLEDSIKSLKSFVSNASHELKTPISIINLTSQNLLSGEILDESEKKKAYRVLIKETKEMSELINNLMTLSKINYSKHRIDIEKIEILKVIRSSLEKYEFLEIKNDLEVDLDIPDDFYIMSDRNLFKVGVDNIIQNALKYSPYEGKVEIYIEEGYLYIKNRIAREITEDVEHLLLPFSRGSNSSGGEIEGSGLGLSIVKNIFELLNMKYFIRVSDKKFIIKLEMKRV